MEKEQGIRRGRRDQQTRARNRKNREELDLCLQAFCCSVAKSCLTLCDCMDCSTPGFPVPHCFPEFAQVHVHLIGDAIQPSPSSITLFSFCLQSFSASVFSKELALPIRWPKYWSFSFSISPSTEYSGLISFKIDWFDVLVVPGTLKSLLQHHSSKVSII